VDWQFYFTIGVMIAMTLSLVREWLDTASAVFGAMLLLLSVGIITPDQAFDGFSNQGMLAVGFLYIIAFAVQSTGYLDSVGRFLLGEKRDVGYKKRLIRFLYPVSFASGFMNNTPIVSMFIPMIKSWCRRMNLSPSKFLMLLSYATILGGTCTLIGSSTNLVVHGYLIDHGYEGFTFFEMGIIGYPIMIVGVLILVFGISHLLPDRKDVMVELDETTRDFVAALKVTDKYRYIGATVENAGLRHLQGLFLFQIERDGERITPVKPDEHILEGDRLFFTGVPSTIVELQKENGLEIINDPDIDLKNYDSNKSKIFEVVVSNGSRLIGKKVKNSNFREMFDAVIIAIHRHGERVESKVGDIRLAAGDTLLVLAPNNFLDKWYNSREFLLVSQSKDVPSRPLWQKIFIISVLGAMILLVTTGIYPMIVGSSLAAAVLMVSRSVTMQDAFKAINWKVLLIIASAFGISEALVNVGISSILAEQIVSLGLTMGEWGVIFLLAGMTLVYSEMVTNSAAAAIIIPLIVVIAEQTGISVHALALSVVFGATISFATPISYQTNTMVQGPGNYKFTDYLKAGIPLDIIMLFSVSTLIYFLIL